MRCSEHPRQVTSSLQIGGSCGSWLDSSCGRLQQAGREELQPLEKKKNWPQCKDKKKKLCCYSFHKCLLCKKKLSSTWPGSVFSCGTFLEGGIG
ncbi:hypothetical protein AMECASPLE_019562 [Ameca splendens]|uniref:Uncharacterized protein n=1 Tax=Ameca splendens TaxID=208324 RepID=A0ABV0ZD33_9TELE